MPITQEKNKKEGKDQESIQSSNFLSVNCDYFLTHQFKHMFGCPKKEYPQHIFWVKKGLIFNYAL